jgi:beta-glucosidase
MLFYRLYVFFRTRTCIFTPAFRCHPHNLPVMIKRYLLTAFIFLAFAVSSSAQTPALYLNPSLPLNERVNDLISRMTLQEKVSQMLNTTPAIPRLHIPAYNWWSEALHGIARSGVATVFPQAIGLGATFDDSLEKQIATAISDEGRAMYDAAEAKGYHEQYGGLTFWSPNINIFRDPRWGRGQETYGEDPFLTSRMGTAFVEGMQGDNPKYLKVAACAKHFAVYSGPEKSRHSFDAKASPHDLHATYLPAFHALVKAGVAGVMCAYNAVDGEPCCANTFLLDDILRKKWGFEGYITSDCGAIADIYQGHQYAKNALEAAAVSLKRGVNLNCGDTYVNLIQAVQQGVVTSRELDSSLAVLLRIRFRLGMFDPKGRNPYDNIPVSVVNSAAHRALAKKAALESVVLLKNDGVLPLKNDLAGYYVTGPTATSIDALIGNYYGTNNNFVTVLEGIAADIAPGSQLKYKPGILLDRPNVNPMDWTTGAAKASDVTIVVMGLTGELEGEEGESILSATSGDRLNYNLPANQIKFLRELRQHNKKPIIAVITGGSPMNLAPVDSLADAVLLAWYPGEEGGAAVADLIFGKASPSGKLPVTFPKSYQQLPPFEDYSMQGRTYRYMTATPLYPFGFGLSYAHFTFSDMKLSAASTRADQDVTASATLTNDGKYAGTQVVQLYISDKTGMKGLPLFNLKGFRRVTLKPGESRTVTFRVDPSMLEVVNEQGKRVLNPGKHEIYIAGAAPLARSVDLGAPHPVSATLAVK